MLLLIDGYNLLHASGVFPPDRTRGTLEAARRALLDALAELLSPREAAGTVVVFDAAEAPPGLPRRVTFRGLEVRFAANHADADELIEELIEDCRAPRALTVVSSDHRIQRAARRRKCQYVDSEPWFAELQTNIQDTASEPAPKPDRPVTEAEVRYWMETFTDKGGRETPTIEPSNPTDPFPPDYTKDLEDLWRKGE